MVWAARSTSWSVPEIDCDSSDARNVTRLATSSADVSVATGAFSFVTPEETGIVYRLDPNVTPDGQSLVSTRLEIASLTEPQAGEPPPVEGGSS